ncbi:hypothetical protein K8352_17480 [Flavobacteriaceae bacterium F89]|uniref:Uncharacterized protein n=1 Tax=Cerina litoralis TaxID=2874477 RepID=A0AAE3JUM9_9FLAO|nr:hypothetical protein [Cerina litoralis]MCG2462557.1 hypothetical protein [Cerina litoralis]
MKKISVILILLSFSASPVYQFGYIAYYELNIDYIIQTYCVNQDRPEMHCDGKCYLMDQLTIGSNKKDSAKSIQLIEVFYPVYFQRYGYNYTFQKPLVKESSKWSVSKNPQSRFLNVPVPPPKV